MRLSNYLIKFYSIYSNFLYSFFINFNAIIIPMKSILMTVLSNAYSDKVYPFVAYRSLYCTHGQIFNFKIRRDSKKKNSYERRRVYESVLRR